jgi:phage-related protein
VDNLGDGIWEVRSRLDNRIARTLFVPVDQEIVLLHGFIKKQQRTPPDELELAKKRWDRDLATKYDASPAKPSKSLRCQFGQK